LFAYATTSNSVIQVTARINALITPWPGSSPKSLSTVKILIIFAANVPIAATIPI
jgi:hypothetical protein